MWTPAFKAFVEPARARDELWRTAASAILSVLICGLWFALVLVALILTSGPEAARRWMENMALGVTPTSVLLMLAIIVGLGIGIAVSVRVLHLRSLGSLIGTRGRPFMEFGYAVAVFAIVILAMWFIWPGGFVPLANVDFNLWITFLPLALVVILAQTGAEELLFRGFLQQQLAARFATPIAWMVVPSLLFGFLHWDYTALSMLTLTVLAATTLFGLLAADLTRMTGSIAMGWGFHFANNCFAVLFLSINGALSGLSLYTTPFGTAEVGILLPLMLRSMVVSVLIWLILRLVLRIVGQSRV